MSNHDVPRTLFVGIGKTGVAWYRCALPAMYLDQDWVGVGRGKSGFVMMTGLTERPLTVADMSSYDVVVLQQPATEEWLKTIRWLQDSGTTVLYEIDDYVQAVRKKDDHVNQDKFGVETVRWYETCMRVCDGIIVSTPWLAKRYRAFNSRVWVCRNGLDLGRYNLSRPDRPGVAIGWSGGTGHLKAAMPWLQEVATVMEQRPEARFVSVGQPFANSFIKRFGAERCLSMGFAPLDTYPAAMTIFDIALAPAGKGNFYRGKSDLRWLEAGALGIPVIADPDVYPDIEHGVTGFHAATPAELQKTLLELIDDEATRKRVGAAARAFVREHRDMRVMAGQWADVLNEAVSAPIAEAI